MGLLGGRRPEEGPDPHLDLKILLFFVAAGLALVGIVTASPWTIYAGILVVMAGLLLRFLPRRTGRGHGLDEGSDETPQDTAP